ncbi:MAG: preprotein translocase subunit SecG [Ferruginibacter sp.]|jgi:preprotein translocase subunit SecG|uniref:preprotein translocase subunit SecG n=1 Tax=Ferruginibacter sp. TaxID=1940288 RepID=UPI002659F6E9|nr:preprotein translocase subunit SecG [Ferruginibacter sp.]MDB5279294.1 preprotein translocase subunit SecG [Ferruginibacter sp.]
MLIVFGILIILSSVILGLIVLVQNPKGGGLSGSLGGFSNQLMGVKQTTDVLEKGTWVFAAVVAILCVMSPVFIPSASGTSSKNDELIKNAPATAPTTNQTNTVPMTAPAAADTTKKP